MKCSGESTGTLIENIVIIDILAACPLTMVMDAASLTHLVSECLEDYKTKIPGGSGGVRNK